MDYSEVFPPELTARMTRLHGILQHVLPSSRLDDWIGGFIGERRPINEVHIFEAIAVVYLEVLNGLDASLKERKRLYSTLCMAASGFTADGIEDGLPAMAPGYYELVNLWERAYRAGERP
jgi:hypothetical protein